jgi:hypothetical protein
LKILPCRPVAVKSFRAAYSAHYASPEVMVRHWRRVALAVARKTGSRVGLDTSIRIATNADLTSESNPGSDSRPPLSDVDPLDELMRLVPGGMARPIRAPKRLRHWRHHAERKKVR